MRGNEKPQTSASTAATRCPRCAKRHREVHGDRRLPDAALPRGDREHAGAGVDERIDARRLGTSAGLDASTTCSGFGGAMPLRTAATSLISSSFMSRRSTSTRSIPGTAPTASMTRRLSSARDVVAREWHRQRHDRRPPVDRTPCSRPSSTTERRNSGSSTPPAPSGCPQLGLVGHRLLGGFPLPA